MSLNKKLSNLFSIINKYNKIIVAYSGGLDSSVLVFLCKYLQKDVIALTAKSDIFFDSEINFAKSFTKFHNIKHKIIKINQLENLNFIKNDINRCYYCKKELFNRLLDIKNKLKYDIIFDGTNFSDIQYDFRPGLKAAKEFNVVHPYVEAKITKEDIKKIAKKFNLNLQKKFPRCCIVTRIPFGIKIEKNILAKILKAEEIIKSCWNKFFRVRHHNDLIRIEVEKRYIKKFINNSQLKNLLLNLKKIGYKFICLDLEGYIPAGKREVNF